MWKLLRIVAGMMRRVLDGSPAFLQDLPRLRAADYVSRTQDRLEQDRRGVSWPVWDPSRPKDSVPALSRVQIQAVWGLLNSMREYLHMAPLKLTDGVLE